ncbi:DMT family protein [Niabella sp. W65]|nr:DMT family protein [Niabella sp. W65]MCH7364360.1 DMT family protein [Niabella sp. W65]ULT46510.1 DMT family protein [Niabella sp. I65]
MQVPANRLGSSETGGPFSLVQLKVLQEVITLVVLLSFQNSCLTISSFPSII